MIIVTHHVQTTSCNVSSPGRWGTIHRFPALKGWLVFPWFSEPGVIKHGLLEAMDHLWVILLLKPPWIGDFPASHVWLPEGHFFSRSWDGSFWSYFAITRSQSSFPRQEARKKFQCLKVSYIDISNTNDIEWFQTILNWDRIWYHTILDDAMLCCKLLTRCCWPNPIWWVITNDSYDGMTGDLRPNHSALWRYSPSRPTGGTSRLALSRRIPD